MIIYWKYHNPTLTAFMRTYLSKAQESNPGAQLQHRWVSYQTISPKLKKAIIEAEDARFIEHGGFDWDGIEQALDKNLKAGHIVAGGSTISQQLAKNLFMSADKTIWRKAQESVITVMLETFWDKQRILEVYLNVIEWGDGVFGAEAATRYYFQQSSRFLSSAQAAWLAAMVSRPRYYDANRQDKRLIRKTKIIQKRMAYTNFP